MKHCYSFDEERFTGDFDSHESALAVATAEGLDSGHATAWIGKQRHPTEWITPSRLGGAIEDYVAEALGDEVGEVAENFALTQDQRVELGQLVLDWVAAGPKFNCYGVKDITEHSLTEPEGDTQTVDMFAAEGGAA